MNTNNRAVPIAILSSILAGMFVTVFASVTIGDLLLGAVCGIIYAFFHVIIGKYVVDVAHFLTEIVEGTTLSWDRESRIIGASVWPFVFFFILFQLVNLVLRVVFK